MAKVTPKMLEVALEELKEDGIPEDLITSIREKVKNEDLEEEQLEYFLNKVYTLYILHNSALNGHPPLRGLQLSGSSSVTTFIFDSHTPCSDGSSPGISGNHQPCCACTTSGLIPS